MTAREEEIHRQERIQGFVRRIVHDHRAPGVLRQQARDVAVAAHTVLTRLQSEQG